MSGRRQSDARAVQYMSRRGGGTRGGGSGMTRENCGHAPPPTEESEAHVEGVSASHDPARSTGEASANDQHTCSTGEKATVLRVDDLDPMVRNVTEVLDASGQIPVVPASNLKLFTASVALDVLGADYTRDVSLAKIIGAGKYAFAELGDSDKLETTTLVIALGHPGGYDVRRTPPARIGRISAKNMGRRVS